MPSSCIRLLEAKQNSRPWRCCILVRGKKPVEPDLQRGQEKSKAEGWGGVWLFSPSRFLTGRQINSNLEVERKSTECLPKGTPFRRAKDKYKGSSSAWVRVCLVEEVLNNCKELSKAGAERQGEGGSHGGQGGPEWEIQLLLRQLENPSRELSWTDLEFTPVAAEVKREKGWARDSGTVS